MKVVKRDGVVEEVSKQKIRQSVDRACKDLTDIDPVYITDEAYKSIFNNIKTSEVDKAALLAARSKIAEEPNYSYVAARLLLNSLYREVFGHKVDGRSLEKDYRQSFITNIELLVKDGRLNKDIEDKFDLKYLSEQLIPQLDLNFKYLGVQTLYDRYLLHINGRRMETPQAFLMRVAMGLCLNEKDEDRNVVVFDLYRYMSTFKYIHATPTLMNSGTNFPQLSSCFLSTMEDSIDGIFGTLHGQARLSKYAGGLGIDITPLRGAGSKIKGTNGKSNGYIPWAKQINTLVSSVDQSGKRLGAAAIYSEPWHVDFPDFLELLKNTGDERRRCHDLHTANWIPDEFMKRVKEDDQWYLFSPDECPLLHSLVGEKFSEEYRKCIIEANNGKIKNFNVLKAKDLWKKMITAIKETGHPWVCFKDNSNVRYTNQHCGTVNSSNLCTEILEHTIPTKYDTKTSDIIEIGETAVCNLASINLSEFVTETGKINWQELKKVVEFSIRMLDNVIDINFYPTKETKNSNFKNRPVGLGLMGWSDTLHKMDIVFDSDEAMELAGKVQEFISYHAILSSAHLAKERGKYPNYQGSLWSQGILPQDTAIKATETLNWSVVRKLIKEHGMRNSLTQAIAPTVTISSIVGCSQSIEPSPSVLYTNSTLSGQFTMFNEFFVKEMKGLGLWNKELINQIIAADGDIAELKIPIRLRRRFKKSFDVDQYKIIDVAAERQKWIDQGISLNLYYAGNSMKEISDLYFHAWKKKLKTTYYLHTLAASKVEKSIKVEVEEPKTCKIGEICESCQ